MDLIHRIGCAFSILALGACLDQPDPERPGYSPRVLERGSRVPSIEDDPVLTSRLMSNAAASGPDVPLRSGFVNGEQVAFWDLGTAEGSVEPAWVLKRRSGDALEDVDHPPIVDALPGADAYTPFRALFITVVTNAYDGERITSFAALEDAIDMGLVEEPEPTGTYVTWPIVPAETTLERRGEGALEAKPIYGEGHSGRYLPVQGERAYERSVAPRSAYLMQRQNEAVPLDEAALAADLNGDGDQLDTNTIFEADASDPMLSGLWMPITITVVAGYDFGDARAESDLFTRGEMGALSAVPGAFIEYAEGEELLFRPLYAGPEP
jgi:hypothetical protein